MTPDDAGGQRDAEGFRHRSVLLDAVRLHTVTAGPSDDADERSPEGLVILVHGFPESWRTWRHQLRALGAAGHRAVAVDVRGYGRSSRPGAVEAYRMLALVGDLVRLVERRDVGPATVVGHDWGAAIAWNCALLRPDLFTKVAGLSVPYTPRGTRRPTHAFADLAGPDHEFYMNYFQEPGRAEAEIEPDIAGWLRGVYGGAFGPDPEAVRRFAFVERGTRMRDAMDTAAPLPEWMEPDHFAHLVAEFERTGISGGLGKYRTIDRDWEDLAAWRFAPVTVPALFIGGGKDGSTLLGQRAIDRFDRSLPRLWRSEILPGCGHWTPEERPDEVNALLLEFLDAG